MRRIKSMETFNEKYNKPNNINTTRAYNTECIILLEISVITENTVIKKAVI